MHWGHNPRIQRPMQPPNINFVIHPQAVPQKQPPIPVKSNSEFNTQRYLISDLRNELANLKTQFSKLMHKPSEQQQTPQHSRMVAHKHSFDFTDKGQTVEKPKLLKKYTFGVESSIRQDQQKSINKQEKIVKQSSFHHENHVENGKFTHQQFRHSLSPKLYKPNGKQEEIHQIKVSSFQMPRGQNENTITFQKKENLQNQLELERKESQRLKQRVIELEEQLKNEKKKSEEMVKFEEKTKNELFQNLSDFNEKLRLLHEDRERKEEKIVFLQKKLTETLANSKKQMEEKLQNELKMKQKEKQKQFLHKKQQLEQKIQKMERQFEEQVQEKEQKIKVLSEELEKSQFSSKTKIEELQSSLKEGLKRNASGMIEIKEEKEKIQQKLTTYLTNIDKLNGKIKEYKNQLQVSEMKCDQLNAIIKEKESAIRGMGRDLKNQEKQLNEQRRVKRNLESLLEDANLSLVEVELSVMNEKYRRLDDES